MNFVKECSKCGEILLNLGRLNRPRYSKNGRGLICNFTHEHLGICSIQYHAHRHAYTFQCSVMLGDTVGLVGNGPNALTAVRSVINQFKEKT